jgi:anionic cell wall polymer biosynthesis LytR-Cps2A-Psr (LCP) family protein
MPQELVYDPSKIIPAGEQVLNGEQAEWLVRHRASYVEGDIGRIKAQRLFLASFVQKIKDMGLFQLTTKVIPKIYDEISSDMAIKDVVKFANSFFDIEMESIRIHMIPGEGYMNDGQAVWAVHADETAQLLNDYFRPYSSDIPVEELEIIRLTHTGDWYEDTDDNFNDLIDGKTPGQKHTDSDISSESG